jgi:hypothetical protein
LKCILIVWTCSQNDGRGASVRFSWAVWYPACGCGFSASALRVGGWVYFRGAREGGRRGACPHSAELTVEGRATGGLSGTSAVFPGRERSWPACSCKFPVNQKWCVWGRTVRHAARCHLWSRRCLYCAAVLRCAGHHSAQRGCKLNRAGHWCVVGGGARTGWGATKHAAQALIASTRCAPCIRRGCSSGAAVTTVAECGRAYAAHEVAQAARTHHSGMLGGGGASAGTDRGFLPPLPPPPPPLPPPPPPLSTQSRGPMHQAACDATTRRTDRAAVLSQQAAGVVWCAVCRAGHAACTGRVVAVVSVCARCAAAAVGAVAAVFSFTPRPAPSRVCPCPSHANVHRNHWCCAPTPADACMHDYPPVTVSLVASFLSFRTLWDAVSGVGTLRGW